MDWSLKTSLERIDNTGINAQEMKDYSIISRTIEI